MFSLAAENPILLGCLNLGLVRISSKTDSKSKTEAFLETEISSDTDNQCQSPGVGSLNFQGEWEPEILKF